MNVGDVIAGFENEDGITLHIISHVDGHEVSIDICVYGPEHEDFSWAVDQLSNIHTASA